MAMLSIVGNAGWKERRYVEIVNLLNDLRDEITCDPNCECDFCTRQYAKIKKLQTELESLNLKIVTKKITL